MHLNDKDITLVNDVIKHFNKTRNSLIVYKLAVRLTNYLGITASNDINEYQFLEILIKDYSYLAAKTEM